MLENNFGESMTTSTAGPRHGRALLKVLLALALPVAALHAQTTDDGIMISKKKFCTGVFYDYDFYRQYWEGTHLRGNPNVGTVTTRTIEYTGNYGITDHLDVIATVPYVYTRASSGVLHGQSGFQDADLALKVKAISLPVRDWGALRLFIVAQGHIPMSNYTPDDLPLSIGLHSNTLTGRGTLNYLGKNGLYLNGGLAYTYRRNVTLDRPFYYTNGQLYLSNQVEMPNQFMYNASAGYRKDEMTLTANYSEQQTRGGGDIRLQDVPFASNRFNFKKIGATLTYPLPRLHQMQAWVIYNNTFEGQNVGKSNNIMFGYLYTFDFNKHRMPR